MSKNYAVYKWNWKAKLRYKLGEFVLSVYFLVTNTTRDELIDKMFAEFYERKWKHSQGSWDFYV